MTDGQGNVVDFRNTVLIMTSNLGTEYVRKGGTLGFLQPSGTDEDREAHSKIEKALKGTFRPEFLNRVDEIIMFSPLSLHEMEQIVTLQMKEIQDRLNEFGVKVDLTEKPATGWPRPAMTRPSAPARCGVPCKIRRESALGRVAGGSIPSGSSHCGYKSRWQRPGIQAEGKQEQEERVIIQKDGRSICRLFG